MRLFIPVLVLLGACISLPVSLSATTIIPFANLGEATTNSDAVVLARAVQKFETSVGTRIFHDTEFEVLDPVKGAFNTGERFVVRALSFHTNEYNIDIAGDFEATPDKKYLLFLHQKGKVWKPAMLSYYVFEQVIIGAEEFLVPIGGQGIEVVTISGSPVSEPLAVYQSAALLQNLKQQLLPAFSWDGQIGRTDLNTASIIVQDRAVPTGCDFMLGNSSFLCRWQDAAIPIYYDDTNVPTDWVGTFFPAILSALTSNYTGISPSDAGAVSFDPDCSDGSAGQDFLDFCDSDLNGAQSALIMFDDPCDEIPSLSGCSGTLAFGGSYSSSATHSYDNLTWRNALYGYVVVNIGVVDCLSATEFEEVVTHELTHVYRMDHLDAGSYPDQNMNPSCCHAINTKDIECMNYAYDISLPVALVSFDARLYNANKVVLKWVTQMEKDNAHFTLQRSSDGIRFEKLAEFPGLNTATGGNYEWVDAYPEAGVNYYRLSQTDWDGTLVHLGIKSVKVETAVPLIRIVPNPVAKNSLRFRIDLPSEFDGFAAVIDKDGRIVSRKTLSLEKGSTWVEQSIAGVSSGVYALRVYDARQQWSARFTIK